MVNIPLSSENKGGCYGYLPPANEVCKGYVFTPVCQSFCSQGGGVPGQVHPRAGTPPPAMHAGIRSTSGRYASYWNAFLFWLWYNDGFIFWLTDRRMNHCYRQGMVLMQIVGISMVLFFDWQVAEWTSCWAQRVTCRDWAWLWCRFWTWIVHSSASYRNNHKVIFDKTMVFFHWHPKDE